MLRARVERLKWKSRVISRSGSGKWGVWEGAVTDGSGVTEAVMDVAGPEARCEQAEGGHQTTAMHAEQLVLVGDSQLEGAYRLDARDEVNDHT